MKREIKNALFSVNFIGAVVITALTFLIGAYEDIGHSGGTILYFFDICMQLSPLIVFIPFVASLPYGYRFIDEYNSNYYRFSLSRSGYKKYVFRKTVAVNLSSFLAVFLGLTFAVLFLLPFSEKINFNDVFHVQLYNTLVSGRTYGFLININEYLYIFVCVFFISLFASLWPIIGMIASTYIKNRYVSLIMPFIIFFLLWQIGGRCAHLFSHASGFLMIINVYYGNFGAFNNIWLSLLGTLIFVFAWHIGMFVWFKKRMEKCW